MLHLILVYACGDILCAKLIRFHRTELISAATLACMGRPWLGLSVGSLMRITQVGRLCVRGYSGPVSGDSLESRFVYVELRPRLGPFCHDGVRLPQCWPMCWDDTGLPKTGCRVI